MTENTIKVKHPEYGLVTFTMMTNRQMDVLNDYKKLTSVNKHSKKNKVIIDAEIRITASNRRY